MFVKRFVLVLALLFLTQTAAFSQNTNIEPGDKYLLLAKFSVSDMQKHLDEASARGFAVVTGSGVSFSDRQFFSLGSQRARPREATKFLRPSARETWRKT